MLLEIAEGALIPIVLPTLLDDLRGVLGRRKFHAVISQAAIDELFRIVQAKAVVIRPRPHVPITRDPDDDPLLTLAVEGGAAAVISGDKDVTSLGSFANIPILTPSQFLSWLSHR